MLDTMKAENLLRYRSKVGSILCTCVCGVVRSNEARNLDIRSMIHLASDPFAFKALSKSIVDSK